MANERLRVAILSSGMEPDGIADALGVDRKTIERWISGHQLPYKKSRYALAALLESDPAYLWQHSRSVPEAADLAMAEILAVHPVRWAVSSDLWLRLFERAEQNLDVLVYAGFWLSEDPAIRRILARKAKAGVQLRFLLGDPESPEVHQRGLDEGIGTAISAKILNTVHNYRTLVGAPNVQFRLHTTVLYNSIYHADDEMLVNTHLYGTPAHMAPVMHLRRVTGAELFSGYLESFERVWAVAKPLDSATLVA
jgi:transcriptional regulator with XRE-family HTH domain